ncbi:MAG: PD40 domain-containing protein [Anaerolineales bacterium]|nr:PD40 domain-containing protein [Anaerolineales bacterium]
MRQKLALLLALSLAAAACQPIEVRLEPPSGSAPPAEPATSVPLIPDTGATATPAATAPQPIPTLAPASPFPDVSGDAAGLPGLRLPAPVYFLLPGSGQVWRLEPDAARLIPITREAAPVTAFDISPTDGALAYVSGNALIQTDALGNHRVVLAQGPDTFGDEQLNREVTNPRWSPDGQWIAFGLNGVNVVAAAGAASAGTPRLVLQNSPAVWLTADTAATEAPAEPARFYRPAAWAPDGERLLVEFNYFPHGGGWLVLDRAGQVLATLQPPEGYPCCEPAWSQDGRFVFFANEQPGLIAPGLWRADAATGEVASLIPGLTQTGMTFVRAPRELADGRLHFLLGTSTAFPEDRPQLVPFSAAGFADSLVDFRATRGESFKVSEVVWDPAGRGLLLVQASASAPWEEGGALIWLSADSAGGPPVALGQSGRQPRWGRP